MSDDDRATDEAVIDEIQTAAGEVTRYTVTVGAMSFVLVAESPVDARRTALSLAGLPSEPSDGPVEVEYAGPASRWRQLRTEIRSHPERLQRDSPSATKSLRGVTKDHARAGSDALMDQIRALHARGGDSRVRLLLGFSPTVQEPHVKPDDDGYYRPSVLDR